MPPLIVSGDHNSFYLSHDISRFDKCTSKLRFPELCAKEQPLFIVIRTNFALLCSTKQQPTGTPKYFLMFNLTVAPNFQAAFHAILCYRSEQI